MGSEKNQIENIKLLIKKITVMIKNNKTNIEKLEFKKEKEKHRNFEEIMTKTTILFKNLIKEISHLNHAIIRLKLEQTNHNSIQLSIKELEMTNNKNLIKERGIIEYKLNESNKLLEAYRNKNIKIDTINKLE